MSKALTEKKNDLITRAEEILNTAKTEQRTISDEERAEIDNIKAEVEKIKEMLILEEEVEDMARAEIKEDKTPSEEDKKVVELDQRAVEMQERKAFDAYIRGMVLRDDPVADVNLTKTDNGAIIPTTIVNYIIRKVYDICPILERSQQFNVKGKLEVPKYPKDANNITVAYANEFENLLSTSGKFDTVELTGFLAGALCKVSKSLVNNVNFNLVDFVVDEMAQGFKRWIEGECLNGTEGKVAGLSTLSNGVVASSASAVTANELIELQDSVKDEFQSNAIWIMNPKTRTAIRELKSTTGSYLLNDVYSLSAPFRAELLGKPVYVSDNMPEMEAGKVAIYYGDMKGLATKFSETMTIEVLREVFAIQHAYGIVGYCEFDANVINEQMIAKLVMAGGSL